MKQAILFFLAASLFEVHDLNNFPTQPKAKWLKKGCGFSTLRNVSFIPHAHICEAHLKNALTTRQYSFTLLPM